MLTILNQSRWYIYVLIIATLGPYASMKAWYYYHQTEYLKVILEAEDGESIELVIEDGKLTSGRYLKKADEVVK
jgi:hypothetical protein